MEVTGSIEQHLWNPLAICGNSSEYLMICKETIITTWIALLAVVILIICSKLLFLNKEGIGRFLIIYVISSLKNFTVQTLGSFNYQHFVFVASIFTFILICNWISLIPFIEEPTKDLNTTLALGCISFFYKEWHAIRVHGFLSYVSDFFKPFFPMFPINVVGHFSKIISLSFRLYGNIFGGSIITALYTSAISTAIIWEIIGIVSGVNFIVLAFFTLFEGFIQAFVFSMLTLTYLSIAIHTEDPGEYYV
jgi:F-type H+-transporting ATPase subunit a